MPVNNQGPVSNVNDRGQSNRASKNGGFIPVRVIDVSLVPEEDGRSTYQLTDGFWGIGAIKFEAINKGSLKRKFPQGSIAYPLDGNYRKMPLINEIVFVILGPSRKRLLDGNSDAVEFYYTSAVNIWNGVHLNALPSPNTLPSSTNNSSNQNVDKGIENNEDGPQPEPSYGQLFTENPAIRNLYPQEGDVIFEGRFGNSLRFTSTNTQPSSSKSIQSPWSTTGKNGTPLTILRNGQVDAGIRNNDWFPIYENIQQDDSSIYLTSGQTIPVALASTIFDSYGIDAVSAVDTTKPLQETPVSNTTVSPKEADSTGSVFDTVNIEPNLNTGSNG